ncbi:MAG: hypothetical protein AAGJ54_08495 [Planctomycetota bacterium]
MATKATASVEADVPLVIDQVMLLNPAIEAVHAAQVIDFLKRSSVRLEIRSEDGMRRSTTGLWAVSITSEDGWVTSRAYRAGLATDRWGLPARRDHTEGEPSQWALATTAEGHAEHLASHRAWVEDGEARIERIENAYNDTPYWIICVTGDICANHGDLANPYFRELRQQIFALGRDNGTRTRRWLTSDPSAGSGSQTGPKSDGPDD